MWPVRQMIIRSTVEFYGFLRRKLSMLLSRFVYQGRGLEFRAIGRTSGGPIGLELHEEYLRHLRLNVRLPIVSGLVLSVPQPK